MDIFLLQKCQPFLKNQSRKVKFSRFTCIKIENERSAVCFNTKFIFKKTFEYTKQLSYPVIADVERSTFWHQRAKLCTVGSCVDEGVFETLSG